MSNLLHDFLHAGNVQSRPVLGELFDFQGQVGLTGFFTPTDAELAFKATGYLEEIDLVGVVDLDQFDAGNEPAVKSPLDYNGNRYSLRSIKTDLSSYTLGFKMIGPTPASGSGFSSGFSSGFG